MRVTRLELEKKLGSKWVGVVEQETATRMSFVQFFLYICDSLKVDGLCNAGWRIADSSTASNTTVMRLLGPEDEPGLGNDGLGSYAVGYR